MASSAQIEGLRLGLYRSSPSKTAISAEADERHLTPGLWDWVVTPDVVTALNQN